MSDDAKRELSRRGALLRLGSLAVGAYTAPAFTTLSIAAAKGSGSSGSGSSGSGSGNSGSGSGSSASGSSGSGSGGGTTGSNSGSSGGKPPVFGGDGIHVQFADGHTERIRNGRYERLDGRGRVVESHSARNGDISRLRRLRRAAQGKRLPGDVRAVVEIDEQRGRIAITDYRGWREIVSGSTYELKDPNGHAVTRRPLTAKDIFRIRDALNLQ